MTTTDAEHSPQQPDYWVASFEKGLSVMLSFNANQPKRTITQIAQQTDLSRSAARRYLLTLQDLGYVSSDGKYFWLTHKGLRMGAVFLESSSVMTRMQPYLQQITTETGESSFISVRDGAGLIYIAKATPNRITNRGFSIGTYAPMFVTSAGIALAANISKGELEELISHYEPPQFTPNTESNKENILKNIEEAKRQGFAVSERQFHDGVRGIAVPIFCSAGKLFGALSVNMFASKESLEDSIRRIVPTLKQVAANLQALI